MKTNELKCTDLRIGNLLKFNDEIVIVYELYDDSISILEDSYVKVYHIDNFKPIELTEEVLVKIGFEDRKGYFNYSRVFGNDGDYCDSIYIYYCPRLKHFKFTHDIVKEDNLQEMDLYNIKYLHELQNAYFLLTGGEMEVEL